VSSFVLGNTLTHFPLRLTSFICKSWICENTFAFICTASFSSKKDIEKTRLFIIYDFEERVIWIFLSTLVSLYILPSISCISSRSLVLHR